MESPTPFDNCQTTRQQRFYCLFCDRDIPCRNLTADEFARQSCDSCHATFAGRQPKEVAMTFYSDNRARAKVIQYQHLPEDMLPPKTRPRQATGEMWQEEAQGFFHIRCRLHAADAEAFRQCLEDDICSVQELLDHLDYFHSAEQLYCYACYRDKFNDFAERRAHLNEGKANRGFCSPMVYQRSIGADERAYIHLMDMTLAQKDESEVTRLRCIASELMHRRDSHFSLVEHLGRERIGLDFIWDDRGYRVTHEDVNVDVMDHVKDKDFGFDVYLCSGVGLQISVLHDLWKIKYSSNMPRPVAREMLSLLETQ